MSCKLRGRLREPERLRGKVTGARVSGPDGLYLGGIYQGVVDGYYVNNSPAPIPDGMYRNGGLVDPYYERIRDAALAEGGGLYLFQFEHGQYAGEQVIWQEMGELTPWVPGLLTPQGKTYDLMGSGEYLGQAVSIRRPVDGVFDGIQSSMIASSDAVGGHLHQVGGAALFLGVSLLRAPAATEYFATTLDLLWAGPGIFLQQAAAGVRTQIYSETASVFLATKSPQITVGQDAVIGFSKGLTQGRSFVDGVSGPEAALAALPDGAARKNLAIGGPGYRASDYIHARYTYIAIYTREPTPYEISLHQRTP